jgi:hypothetical protein
VTHPDAGLHLEVLDGVDNVLGALDFVRMPSTICSRENFEFFLWASQKNEYHTIFNSYVASTTRVLLPLLPLPLLLPLLPLPLLLLIKY